MRTQEPQGQRMTKKRTHRLSLWNRHSWDSPQEILRAVEGLTGEVSTVTPANAESPPMANVNSTAPTATIDEAGSSSPVKIQPDLSSTIPLDPVDPISELPLAEPDSTSSPQQRSAPILSKDPCFKSEIDNQFEIVGWSNRRSEPMDQATASSNEAEAKPVEQASHPPMSTRGVEEMEGVDEAGRFPHDVIKPKETNLYKKVICLMSVS